MVAPLADVPLVSLPALVPAPLPMPDAPDAPPPLLPAAPAPPAAPVLPALAPAPPGASLPLALLPAEPSPGPLLPVVPLLPAPPDPEPAAPDWSEPPPLLQPPTARLNTAATRTILDVLSNAFMSTLSMENDSWLSLLQKDSSSPDPASRLARPFADEAVSANPRLIRRLHHWFPCSCAHCNIPAPASLHMHICNVAALIHPPVPHGVEAAFMPTPSTRDHHAHPHACYLLFPGR